MTDPRIRPAARASRQLPISAERAWELVTDVRNHARWLPWTRIDAPRVQGVGAAFSGASGPISLPGAGFIDRMVVRRLDPPSSPQAGSDPADGVAVYGKLGPIILGTTEIHIRPTGPASCRVTWVERVYLRGTPAWVTAPLLWPVLTGRAQYALRRMAGEKRLPGA